MGRKYSIGLGVFILLAAGTAAIAAAPPGTISDLKTSFQKPPDDARIMMRWWWYGPSQTKAELERELRQMKEGGIGGFEVQATYPLALDGAWPGFHNYPYLSDEYLDALSFTAEKAKELGLRFDLTLGSGWPYGGPHISTDLASPRLRMAAVPVAAGTSSVPIPRLEEGESFVAAYLARAAAPQAAPAGRGRGRGGAPRFAPEGIRQLTVANGAAAIPAGTGDGQLALFFIASRTKQMVKRAAVGAEGYVLDHYSRAAIDKHLNAVADRMFSVLAKNPPYAVFSDSLEVYQSDWAADMLEQFRKRRGYDLTPYLPALAGDIGDKTAAVRRDWGRTLTELTEERYLTPITQWAKQHNTRFRSQTYGIPPVVLSSASLVDLPEGEGSQWRQFSTSRWASSSSHLYGKPVTSSETWTWLHSPVFAATPLDMKAEADIHFLQGINQFIGHGWPYSPPEAGEPGWRFYAAAVFNAHNPWWNVMPDMSKYMQRVSYLLRQGQPANDVAVYLPTDDAYARFTLGNASVNQMMQGLLGDELVPQILDAGYGFDFIDDGAIVRNGVPFRILVMPGVERVPLATYKKIEEYIRKGGIVIATRRTPSLAPGLQDERDTPAIQALSRDLFAAQGARGKMVTDETALGSTLRAALQPDVAKAPEIGFVHRKLPYADVYFLANTSNRPVRSQVSFRVSGMNAASWDPFTGKITGGAGAKMELDLAPYESRVIVFSKDSVAAPRQPSGPAPAPIEITSPWKVTFGGAAPAVTMAKLHSWADDEATKYYSGLASYETTVNVPQAMIASGRTLYLDFGQGTPVQVDPGRRAGAGMRAMLESPVREGAQVYVNGKPAGSVWTPPYQIDITGLVRGGENAIRVVVGNLALNEMSKGPLPDYKELNAKYGERFQAQDMDKVRPQPSGLLEPVRVIAK